VGFESPQQKPLDTLHEKHIFIEDIVVDNPWEGSKSVGTTGIRPTKLLGGKYVR
jgi:hypothetical protein